MEKEKQPTLERKLGGQSDGTDVKFVQKICMNDFVNEFSSSNTYQFDLKRKPEKAAQVLCRIYTVDIHIDTFRWWIVKLVKSIKKSLVKYRLDGQQPLI